MPVIDQTVELDIVKFVYLNNVIIRPEAKYYLMSMIRHLLESIQTIFALVLDGVLVRYQGMKIEQH